MALKKKKVGTVAKKAVVTKKKKAAKRPALKKSPIKHKQEEAPEALDLYERARWKKERREYWRNRFRKILSNLSTESKGKK